MNKTDEINLESRLYLLEKILSRLVAKVDRMEAYLFPFVDLDELDHSKIGNPNND